MNIDPKNEAALPVYEAPVFPMPMSWRLGLALFVVGPAIAAYVFGDSLGSRGQAALGLVCFLCLTAALSQNVRAVNWRTIILGIMLQVLLAVSIIKVPLVHVNSADDFINPPELGVAEKMIQQVPGGRFVLIPASDQTHGHGTHTWPVFWQNELVALLAKTKS